MEVKETYLVTHGETDTGNEQDGWKPDPAMTPEGLARVQGLREELSRLLPEGPPEVYCGMGRRQYQVIEALGLMSERVLFSDLYGGAATLITVSGVRCVLLGHGQIISFKEGHRQYRSSEDLTQTLLDKIRAMKPGALIGSGRPVLARLGVPPEVAQSGALYAIEHRDGGRILKAHVVVSGVNLLVQAAKA